MEGLRIVILLWGIILVDVLLSRALASKDYAQISALIIDHQVSIDWKGDSGNKLLQHAIQDVRIGAILNDAVEKRGLNVQDNEQWWPQGHIIRVHFCSEWSTPEE